MVAAALSGAEEPSYTELEDYSFPKALENTETATLISGEIWGAGRE